jgi:hypothetical protein
MPNRKEPVLSEDDIEKTYKQTLRVLSMTKGTITDATRQSMADAVHEFHRILLGKIEAKRSASS